MSQPFFINGLVFVAFLALYLQTLVRDLLPADNGEFQLVAAVLGVAHPPGYPLHTVLGWLISQLPVGAPLWRVNLLSALLAAGTLTLLGAAVRHLTGRPLAGMAASLALGTSTTFWSQATMTNVRTPAAFFVALGLYALARYQKESHAPRYLAVFLASLVLGLTHHLSLAFIGFFLVVYLFLIDPRLFQQPRRWRRPLLIGLLCLCPLLYLPLRAGAPLAPENLDSLEGFLQHVLALGFSGDFFYFIAPADLWARLLVMGNVFTFQFHPLLLAAAVLGALLMIWRNRRLAVLLLGGLGLHTLVTATYRAPQTVEYMLPAYVLLAAVMGYGLGVTLSLASQAHRSPAVRVLVHVPLVLVLLAGLSQGVQAYPSYRQLSRQQEARDYARPILEHAPEGALLLADWHWVMPLRYLQMVEGFRPDLEIQYVHPTAEPYEQSWARRIREALPERPVVVTHYDQLAYADIPAVFEPLGEAFWVRAEPRRELPAGYEAVSIHLGDTLELLGYRLDHSSSLSLDSPAVVTLAWSYSRPPDAPVSLFVHLIGYDGKLYAQQDQVLDSYPGTGDVLLARFLLEPRPGALPGRYSVQTGAYTFQGPLTADLDQERVELTGVDFVPVQSPPFSQRPRSQPLGEGLRLMGVDWDLTVAGEARLYLHWRAGQETGPRRFFLLDEDRTLLEGILPALSAGAYQTTVHTLPAALDRPALKLAESGKAVRLPLPEPSEQYLPFGSGIVYLGCPSSPSSQPPATFYLDFAASRPVLRDYVVSTSLIGLNPDKSWAWRDLDDGIPAMGAIPTLKWIAGSRVTDPHSPSSPSDAPAGEVIGALILYDAFTGRTLPLLDERLAAVAPWAPLGEWVLQP